MKKADVRVGCCGFAVSQHNYFSSFQLIEIQHTFYQLPQLKTAEKWRNSSPRDFEFTMKAWQLITHEPKSPTYRRSKEKIDPAKAGRYGGFKPTIEVADAWDRTACFAQHLDATIVVFQCPASFRPTDDNIHNLRKFFADMDRRDLTLAWEPRGSWPEMVIRQLCEELQLIHCADPFKNEPQFGEFDYLRLHGITGYNYAYTDEDLKNLASRLTQKPTYVMFNNSRMYEDALRFIKFAGR